MTEIIINILRNILEFFHFVGFTDKGFNNPDTMQVFLNHIV